MRTKPNVMYSVYAKEMPSFWLFFLLGPGKCEDPAACDLWAMAAFSGAGRAIYVLF